MMSDSTGTSTPLVKGVHVLSLVSCSTMSTGSVIRDHPVHTEDGPITCDMGQHSHEYGDDFSQTLPTSCWL